MLCTSQRGGIMCAARAFLWLVVLCSVSCFLLITFMRPTPWYISNQEFTWIRGNMTLQFPGDVPVLTGEVMKKGKLTVVNIGKDTPLWSGQSAFPVTLQVGSVMMAALAAAGLHLIAQAAASTTAATTPGSSRNAFSQFCASVAYQARCIASYQLPPRKVWVHLCGGLSVLDACLVAVWCGLTVVYLYYNIARKFESTAKSFEPSPPPPGAASPPSPSAANATSTSTDHAVDISYEFAVRRLDSVGKAFGETLRMLMMIMFFPVSRSSFLQYLLGSDFSSLIKYHRWMSWGTIFIMLAHGTLYMIEWGSLGTFKEELSGATSHGQRNVAGLVAAIAGLLMAGTSTTWFRTQYFKIFYKTHIGGFVVFLLFSLMHYKNLVNWILPALILYGLDRAFRYWQLASNWCRVSAANMTLEGNILTLTLTWAKAGAASISPGQTVYLRVPAISLFHSHPFSVADMSEEGDVTRVTLHLRVAGSWTQRLVQRLLQGQVLRLQVEGPYDSKLGQDRLQDAPVLVVISGGIGVTPILALLRRYARLALSGKLVPQVHFVWASRSLAELRLMGQDLLAAAAHTRAHVMPGLGEAAQKLAKAPSGSGSDSPTSMDSTSSWLHASLHYTGLEQELEQQQQAIDLAVAGKPALSKQAALPSPAADTSSIPAGRPLQLHPLFHPLVYAACVLLAFFGAWAGLLAAAYYDGYYARTTEEGADYLSVGVLQFVTISAGAVLPPFLFLALLHSLRRRPAELSSTQCAAGKGNSLMVLPGYVLAPAAAAKHSDGMQLPLARGRPCFPELLQRVREQYPHLSEVQVLVGGPEAMYQAVVDAVARSQALCASSQHQGPAMRVMRVAHHH